MRNAIAFVLFVLFSCMSVTAFAVPPEKSTILHCGCTLEGDAMEYGEITISGNSKGHDAHVATSVDACFDGVDTWTDFVRTGDDCQISGPPLGDPIDSCASFSEPPEAGDSCGEELIL